VAQVEAVVADVVEVGCEECVTVDPQMSREFGGGFWPICSRLRMRVRTCSLYDF